MPVPFVQHLALLDYFISHRGEAIDRLESQFLNVRDKPLVHSRDRRVFERLFEASLFGQPSLPKDLRGLRGDLEARHVADGFEPVVMGRHVHDLDPLELILRAYEHWGATRWPGRAGRLAYAGTIVTTWMLTQIGHLTLRIWDEGGGDADARLAALQEVLDRLNAAAPDDVMVRDVRWLLQTTLGPFTRHLEPYLLVADRIERWLPASQRLGVHDSGARLAGGHLRSQLRYRIEEASRPIDDPESLAITRNSNSLDGALLVADLVPLLETYRAASHAGDDARRLDLADAILQGVSADPELFLVRWDLLTPSTMIERAFIATGNDGRPHYTPIGERHMERLGRYRALLGELASGLRRDAETLAPVAGTYSPYGVTYGFITDVLANMAMARLVGQPSRGLTLEDVFGSRGRLDDKLARSTSWQGLPMRPGEQEHFSHSDAWAARIHARLVGAVDARVREPAKPNASSLRDARIVFTTSAAIDEVARSGEGVRADEFCFATDQVRASASGATTCTEAELIADRDEARLLACIASGGQSFAVSKVLLTLVLAQGLDAALTDVPDDVVTWMALTCPEIVSRP